MLFKNHFKSGLYVDINVLCANIKHKHPDSIENICRTIYHFGKLYENKGDWLDTIEIDRFMAWFYINKYITLDQYVDFKKRIIKFYSIVLE